MIERAQLLAKLNIVAPALAENDLVPELTHFLFNDNKLTAYNERIAISTPLESEFSGVVPGKSLQLMVNMAPTDKIKMKNGGEHAQFSSGRAKMQLGMLPVQQFTELFTMPGKPKQSMEVDQNLMDAIEHCLLAVDSHSTVPDRLGITVIPEASQLSLYATTGITLARTVLPVPRNNTFKRRCILSADFCKELVRLGKDSDARKLSLQDSYAIFSTGQANLFGKLLITEHPIEYQRVMNAHLPQRFPDCMPNIGESTRTRLKHTLDLANGVAGVVGSEPYTEVEVTEGSLWLKVESARGKFDDRVPIANHPPAACKLLISNVANCYERFQDIMFTNKAVLLSKPDSVYMVSAAALR